MTQHILQPQGAVAGMLVWRYIVINCMLIVHRTKQIRTKQQVVYLPKKSRLLSEILAHSQEFQQLPSATCGRRLQNNSIPNTASRRNLAIFRAFDRNLASVRLHTPSRKVDASIPCRSAAMRSDSTGIMFTKHQE